MTKEILIGAHTSIAGGAHNALYEGQKIKANTIQIFTTNQRQWRAKKLSQEQIELFKTAKKETNIKDVMSHNNYLTNLGSNKKEVLEKSRKSFEEEIQRCLDLEIKYLNFHPGAATGSSEEECLDKIVESLLLFKDFVKNKNIYFIIETTAGQGSCLGYKFEHLAYIIKNTKKILKWEFV